jgi:hypothetical protein
LNGFDADEGAKVEGGAEYANERPVSILQKQPSTVGDTEVRSRFSVEVAEAIEKTGDEGKDLVRRWKSAICNSIDTFLSCGTKTTPTSTLLFHPTRSSLKSAALLLSKPSLEVSLSCFCLLRIFLHRSLKDQAPVNTSNEFVPFHFTFRLNTSNL